MVNMCKELGARVVAEGVETVDELACVRDLGVDFAQGYLLARPATPPPVHAWPLAPKKEAPRIRRLPPPLPKAVRKSARPPSNSKGPPANKAVSTPPKRTPSSRVPGPAPPRG